MWIDPAVEDRILGEAEQRRRQFAAMTVTPDQINRAVALTRQAPNASPGLVQTAVMQGFTDDQFLQVAEHDDGGQYAAGPFGRAVGAATGFIGDQWDRVWQQSVMPTVRAATSVLDFAAQEVVQRPLTAASAVAFGDSSSLRQAYDEYGDSPLLNVIQGDYDLDDDPEGGVLGKGLFPGGAAGARSAQERTLTIGGREANLGRALPQSRLVGELVGYDSQAYDVVAGVSQFAADIALDPVAIATGGSTAAARTAGALGASRRVERAIEQGIVGTARARRTLDGGEAASILREAEAAAVVPRPAIAASGERAAELRAHAGALSTAERNTVLAERANTFFRDPHLLQRLAEADAYTIYRSFRRSSANRFDRALIGRLGAAADEAEVADVLLRAVAEGHIVERGFYSGFAGFRRTMRDRRFSGLSPRGRVSADDLDTSADRLDSLLRQARVPTEVRAQRYNELASLEAGDGPGLWRVVTDALDDVASALPEGVEVSRVGQARQSVRELTRIYADDVEAFRQYGVDRLGDPIQTPFTKRRVVQQFDGEDVELLMPTPQISSELADVAFELPDPTSIRRAATRTALLRSVYTSRGWDVTQGALSAVTRKFFKPLAIIRPAYVVRIGLEEQGRLAAANLDSVFTHPFRFIQANIVHRQATGDLLGRDATQLARDLGVITREATGILDDARRSRTHVWGQLTKSDSEQFVTAWRHELGQLSYAPEARQLASTRGNLDAFADWARNTEEGRQTVARVARVSDDSRDLVTNDRALREWGESIVTRLDAKTGRDGDLLDAIATGKLGGEDFADPFNNARLNQLLRSKSDRAPAVVKVEKTPDEVPGLRQGLDRAVEYLFDITAGKPTSYFARYPAWRQRIVRNVGELMPNLADDKLRLLAVRAAEKNLNLTRAELRLLSQSARDAGGSLGVIDKLDDLNEIAITRAADQVKDLLFDTTRRSAFQETFDVMVPFYDAWKEVSLTWAGLVKENPAFFARAIAGYRQLEGSGVITANDHGENVFHYPGGGALSAFVQRMNDAGGGLTAVPGAALGAIGDTITGDTPEAQVSLEGRVEGVNLVVQGVGPGFGPVVQWAAGAFVPDTPEYDHLREFIAPFGTGNVSEPADLLDAGNVANSLLPAWFDKLRQAWTGGEIDPVQWNGMVGDAMTALATTGGYDPADPDDGRRLMADAERAARWLLFVRGAIQATGPTGPSATWKLNVTDAGAALDETWDPEADPEGTWHTLATLGNAYRDLAERYQGDHQLAGAQFIANYGIEPYYLTQAKSRALVESPVSTEGDRWMRSNVEFAERYPAVAGYFAPSNEDAPLDYSVYRRQFEQGARQSLSGQQQLALANQTKARAMRAAVVAQLDGAGARGEARTAALAQVDAVLEERFPGWRTPVLGVQEGSDQATRITQLTAAVQDEAIADAPITVPLRAYLALRTKLLEVADSRGVKTFEAQASADLRAALETVGVELAQRYPEFRGVWSRLLSRELETR